MKKINSNILGKMLQSITASILFSLSLPSSTFAGEDGGHQATAFACSVVDPNNYHLMAFDEDGRFLERNVLGGADGKTSFDNPWFGTYRKTGNQIEVHLLNMAFPVTGENVRIDLTNVYRITTSGTDVDFNMISAFDRKTGRRDFASSHRKCFRAPDKDKATTDMFKRIPPSAFYG